MKKHMGTATSLVAIAMAIAIVIPAAGGAGKKDAFPWDEVLGADPAGLSDEQKSKAVEIMGTEKVYFGCDGTIAACLGKDPASMTARRLAGMVARKVKAGHDAKAISDMIARRAKSMHPAKAVTVNVKDAPWVGAESPEVAVAAFADFECPHCRKVMPRLEKLAKSLVGVRLYFKHFPVKSHAHSVPAAVASLAAQLQGKFWEFHEKCYADPENLGDADLVAKAEAAGVPDMAKFEADLKDPKLVKRIESDKLDGLKLGVKGTPTVFIDGKEYLGETELKDLEDVLLEELDLVAGKK